MQIQPPKFRFTLLIRGVLKEVLKNAPEKWQETIVNFKRSDTYKGIVRSLTTPMNFVYDGAYYIRKEYYQYGILSNIKVIIDKLIPSTWAYKNVYQGVADFTQYQDADKTVQLTSGEDDISVNIKANEDVDYAINLDVPEATTVTLNPINLKEKADMIFNGNIDQRSDAFFQMTVVNNEQHATLPSVQDVGFFADNNPNFNTSQYFFFIARTNTIVRIQGHIEGLVIPPAITNKRYQINVYGSNGYKNTLYDRSGSTPTNFSIDFDFTVTVNIGDKLFFYFENVGDTDTNNGFRVAKGNVSLNYSTATPSTTCKALSAYQVFDKLIQLMNGADTGGVYTPYPTRSNLLTGSMKQLYITCSNSIRKIENGTTYNAGDVLTTDSKYQVVNSSVVYNGVAYAPGSTFTAVQGVQSFTTTDNGSVILISFAEKIIISFKEFFQSIYAVMGGNCSHGIENNKAFLEDLSYVYRTVQSIALGANRKNVKVSPAIDLLFNSIKVGYQDPQLDSLNGTQAVNSEQTWRMPDMPINKELNLISVINSEAYDIEQIRTVPADTAASRSDNKPYFLWLDTSLTTPLTGDVTGVDAGSSYYNWYLSPKQNLLRGGSYLASIFFNMQGRRILFTSALKNSAMSVNVDGKVIIENENIQISNLPNAIFQPNYIDLSTDLKAGALDNIDGIPYGYLSFYFNEAQIDGYINEISVDLGQNSTRDFKLIATPNTNLQAFIR